MNVARTKKGMDTNELHAKTDEPRQNIFFTTKQQLQLFIRKASSP